MICTESSLIELSFIPLFFVAHIHCLFTSYMLCAYLISHYISFSSSYCPSFPVLRRLQQLFHITINITTRISNNATHNITYITTTCPNPRPQLRSLHVLHTFHPKQYNTLPYPIPNSLPTRNTQRHSGKKSKKYDAH